MSCIHCESQPNDVGPGCPCHHAPCIHDRNADIKRLRALLEEARDEINEAWGNVESSYTRDKYRDDDLVDRINAELGTAGEL